MGSSLLREKRQPAERLTVFFGCGGRTRTYDLRVMSPTSFQLLYSAIRGACLIAKIVYHITPRLSRGIFCRKGNVSGCICRKADAARFFHVFSKSPKTASTLCLGKHLAVVREVNNIVAGHISAQPGIVCKLSAGRIFRLLQDLSIVGKIHEPVAGHIP